MTPSPAATATPTVRPRPAPRGRPLRPSRPPAPRRISGPARSRPATAGAASLPWPGGRSARTEAWLPDRLFDRIIGSRAWIAVIAFALIGIVAMQLWVVKLGVGIGRALEHTQLLARENSALEVENSTLSSAARIEQLALAKGMVLAPPGALHFLTPRGPLDARLAALALARSPQPSSSPSSSSSPPSSSSSSSTVASTEPADATTGSEAAASTTGESTTASTEPADATTGSEAAASTTGEAGLAASSEPASAGAYVTGTQAPGSTEAPAGGD
jgi:cell division protein FtsL